MLSRLFFVGLYFRSQPRDRSIHIERECLAVFTFAKLGCFVKQNFILLFLYYSAKGGPKQHSFSMCILRSLWYRGGIWYTIYQILYYHILYGILVYTIYSIYHILYINHILYGIWYTRISMVPSSCIHGLRGNRKTSCDGLANKYGIILDGTYMRTYQGNCGQGDETKIM